MESMLLSNASNQQLITAIEENAAGYYLHQATSPYCHLDGSDAMIRVMSEIPFPIGNVIIHARLSATESDIDEQVQNALNPYKAHDLPVVWIVDSDTTPPDLGSYLIEAGMFEAPSVPGMAAPIDRLASPYQVSPDIIVEQVRDEAMLAAWIDVFEAVFGIPEWAAEFWFKTLLSLSLDADEPLRHYIARVGDQVVGTSSMLLWGGVAGIYNVATIHAARRRGVATATTLMPLQAAYEEGYRVAVLQSSPMALSLFRQLGFVEYCQFGAYAWMGQPPQDEK